ncbi:hypothetical protein [Deinococcus sp.]|uniref:hypothetical protein n=1 Tax=Deinococcus sp. TaxID=47478 RepID=UPI0025C6B44A|nr:hypothetical protein [Deinococcus sp.]
MKERRPRTPRPPDSPEAREAAAIARVARAARAAARKADLKADLKADQKADQKQAQRRDGTAPASPGTGVPADQAVAHLPGTVAPGGAPPDPAAPDPAVPDPAVPDPAIPHPVAGDTAPLGPAPLDSAPAVNARSHTQQPDPLEPGALDSGALPDPPLSPFADQPFASRPEPAVDSMTELDGHLAGDPLPAAPADDAHGSDLSDLVPELTPMFPGAAPFLARFLPHSEPSHTGLTHHFCDLHAFLKYLHERGWYGYLHAALGEQSAFVLLFDGRAVTAAAASSTGEQALGELLNLYEQGASLSAHPLPADLAHVLSGVGSRAWKFNLTEDFTGLHARPTGAIYYLRGQIMATLAATLPYEGAFPAPLRPQTLILPRSLAGWAHHHYAMTLRGRDATNAITGLHQTFRARHGVPGLAFLRALSESLSPAEYALRSDVALHDLEAMVQEFLTSGYIREI